MLINISPRQAVALAAVAGPALYLLLLNRSVMRKIESCATQRHERGPQTEIATSHTSYPPNKSPGVVLPRSLPQAVADAEADGYVLWHERVVSKPAALSELGWSSGSLDELLTRYVRATMVAFTRTPQAYLIRKMLPADVGETFAPSYINTLDFATVDQRVDGVYTVQYRGGEPHGERVEMRLSAPEEFRGPRSDGIIVAAIEPIGAGASDDVVFVNEAWFWRRKNEKPTLLEGSISRWLHSILVAWLIGKGIESIRKQESLARK